MQNIVRTSFLIKADNACDYIPFISTASNVTDLFQKCVMIPSSIETGENNHYYRHLHQKSFSRCVSLLVPIVGNIVVGLYDLVNMACHNKSFMLTAVSYLGNYAFRFASPELQGDKDVAIALVKNDGCSLSLLGEVFQNDPDVVLAAVEQNGFALQHASSALRSDYTIALAALRRSYSRWRSEEVFAAVGSNLKDHPDFMLAVLALPVFKNKDFEGSFPPRDLNLIKFRRVTFASDRLKDNKEFMLSAIKKNSFVIEFASKRLLGDKEIVLAAFENGHSDSENYYYAHRLWESLNLELKNDKDIIIIFNQIMLKSLEERICRDANYGFLYYIDHPSPRRA